MAKKTWAETWGTLEKGSFWNEDVSIESLQKLIDAGADVNARNKYGSTPLHRAIEINRMDIVDFLLEQGCEPSLSSALARAAESGRVQIAERLLKAGANPNYRYNVNDWSRSVLYNASRCEPEDRQEMVKLLLEYGAVPTTEDIDGFKYCDDEVIHHMLANPDLYRRKKENDVLDWIQEHPDPAVEDFLAPMGDNGENVVTSLVRAGSRVLEMAFPLQKWARLDCRDDLHKIFATVPREEKLLKTMIDLDEKLKTTYNYNQRRQERQQERQRRNDLADMLLAISDPALRREMDDKMRQKWGLQKRTSLKKNKEV